MCYVLGLYEKYTCGHQVLTKRNKVDCGRQTCGISHNHLSTKHDCVKTCIRRMSEDQALITEEPPRPCNQCRFGSV
ncbi:hypothetical protein BDQ17DRAFT_1361940 [Cyathus striatus]|nr:hypothetical protein BDQ17DRAFT_1361940 [Cyathus striatus]